MLLKLRNMMDIIDVLLQWYITIFKKRLLTAEELHKPVTRKFKKRKVQPSFIDNILEVDPENSN